jgi:flavin reductase (DIM6/NTAB) family NADH-FMN oxidoreductase RutF
MTTEQGSDSQEIIGKVLGRTPSGVFVLTAGDGNGRETGMLASWVQQAAFEPPMVSVAVNQSRYLNEWLAKSPKLALSLVGESQGEFLRHFGKGFGPDEPAFRGLEINRGVTGLPVLAKALGYLEGRVTGQVEAGDHVVYLVEIEGAGAGGALPAERPMVHIRKNGFNY